MILRAIDSMTYYLVDNELLGLVLFVQYSVFGEILGIYFRLFVGNNVVPRFVAGSSIGLSLPLC